MKTLRGVACPECGKKTLSHPVFSPHDCRPNPDRDRTRAYCRSCPARFRLAPKPLPKALED